MHKYQPDRAIGSTWHPLLHQHHPELAIQEDETAIVVYALGIYLKTSGDKEFLKNIYSHLVKPAADFMASYMDRATGLPHASYDLWEEKFGTHTYTVAVTQAALEQACYIAQEIGVADDAQPWRECGERIKNNFGKLFSDNDNYFRKSVMLLADGNLDSDNTLDVSSAYGLILQGADFNDPKIRQTFEAVEKKLLNCTPSGGIPRYEHDKYFLSKTKYLGNPWIVATLWQAQYYIKTQRPEQAKELIKWTMEHCGPSGMLPEQVDPETGDSIGVMPLVWSHAAFVDTVLMLAGVIS
jgi:glucoamylase